MQFQKERLSNLCENKVKFFNYAVFPSIITEVVCDNFDEIQNPLLEWIYDYKENNEGVIFSNRGGWQSPSDFWKEISFSKYYTYIVSHISESTKLYNRKFQISNMWININGKGDYNIEHDHPNSILSGVIWIKTFDKCGNLKFISPKSFLENHLLLNVDDDYRKMVNYYESYLFQPNDGLMVLFPSHMRHYVEPNELNEDRISIAFNLN
jgi:uncharacterized protein (TIGR02466 family)